MGWRACCIGGRTERQSSSTQSAIIVPPAGGGTDYHVFCVSDDAIGNSRDPVWHNTFRPGGGTITEALIGNGSDARISDLVDPRFDNTERLAAVSHADCDKYWVLTQSNFDGNTGDEPFDAGTFFAYLVENDQRPTSFVKSTTQFLDNDLNTTDPSKYKQGYMKFSPDGTYLAWAAGQSNFVAVHHFDRATGALTDAFKVMIPNRPYGLEFSEDSQNIYVSCSDQNQIWGFAIAAQPVDVTDTTRIDQNQLDVSIAALQLAPNGKIYGKRGRQNSIFEIGTPNTFATPSIDLLAKDHLGADIELTNHTPATTQEGHFGLSTFTRIADTCVPDRETEPEDGVCETLAADVNDILSAQTAEMVNSLNHCDGTEGTRPEVDVCTPLEVPQIKPEYHISWGASECDCVESDDVEVMTLTICNPYSNVALSGLTVHKLTVVDENGDPVPQSPDGTPSITLVPIGPYCFGDIAPCSCVSREFTLRTRATKSGRYRILVEGICFDVCLHQDDRTCFELNICKD